MAGVTRGGTVFMRYLKRLIIYIILFFLTYSVSTALLFRFIPVTVTPLKVVRLFENLHEEGLTVHSNWVPLKKINPTMVQAVVATEDNNYLTHNGFDWEAINQALDENREGKRLRGGSTISQQTAKPRGVAMQAHRHATGAMRVRLPAASADAALAAGPFAATWRREACGKSRRVSLSARWPGATPSRISCTA